MSDIPWRASAQALKCAFSLVWVMWVLFCFSVDRQIPVLVCVCECMNVCIVQIMEQGCVFTVLA